MTDIASKLRFIISQDGWVDIQEVDVDSQVNEIEALIADECRKARIDELQNRLRIQFIPSHWERLCSEVNSWAKYVDRRIGDLKAERNNPENEEK